MRKCEALRVLAVLWAGVWTMPLAAQSTEDAQKQLDDLRGTISEAEARQKAYEDEARTAAEDARSLSARLVEQGEVLRQTEAAIARLEGRVETLEETRDTKRAELTRDRGAMVQLIASLERLHRRPAILSLLQPAEAITTARSVGVIGGMVPEINEQAIQLRSDLDALRAIEDSLMLERGTLNARLDRLASERAELNDLLALRQNQAEGATAQARRESARLARLAAEADDLEALLTKLLARAPVPRPSTPERASPTLPQPPAPTLPTGTKFSQARGSLLYPVVSTQILGFGAQDGNIASQGIKSRARAGAQVRSPFDGQIVFSGPFRNYGELLIIDHGDGYHSLLAGMGAIYAERGQQVLAGEPVGTVHDTRREFYLELRHQGKAIDPAPWFKVQTAAAR